MEKYKKGIYFALITALISGLAIFMSSFAVKMVKDPFVLTTARNTVVALMLVLGLFIVRQGKSFSQLTPKEWLYLAMIGLIGGSLPFLLFFKGLSMTTAPNAAFLHKTLFIWVAILAIPLLKERLSIWQLGALGLLLYGNYLLGGIKGWQFGRAEQLVFLAVILWTFEIIIAKKALKTIPAQLAATGRMFFGSIIMLIYLWGTDKIPILIHLSGLQWVWVLVGSALLLGYVSFWYQALKNAPATVVTCVLTLGSFITTLLSSIFITHQYPSPYIWGIILIVIGAILYTKSAPKKLFGRKYASSL